MTTATSAVPLSLWEATAAPPPPTAALEAHKTVDVAIIGAGFTGLSTALHLAEAGRSVAVLEAFEIGHGGSGRNNGMVIPALSRTYPDGLRARFGFERGSRFARLIGNSATEAFALIRRLGIECDAVQGGWVQPAHSPGRAKLVHNRYEQWQSLGFDVEYLDESAVRKRVGSPLYHAGWLAKSGGHVHPLKLVRGLATAAIAAGAQIHTHSPALAVSEGVNKSGWEIATARGKLSAGKVIVATNAYTDNLFPSLRRSFVATRSSQLATAPLPPDVIARVLKGGLASSDTHGDLFFAHPTPDNRIVTGGKLFFPHNRDVRLRAHVTKRLARIFPAVGAEVQFDYAWHGDVAITVDFNPRLNQLAPGILAVAGYSGRGVALSIALGQRLAEAAQDIRAADDLDIPLTPVAPIPLHGLLAPLSRFELLRYRLNDRREVRT
ncbi:FAD-dependent oxidoreductase [Betaproteobacteria bacterium]|nr:FAD-dependent oxidoreductase [Betaproteobacteria bacterium]